MPTQSVRSVSAKRALGALGRAFYYVTATAVLAPLLVAGLLAAAATAVHDAVRWVQRHT